MINDIMIENTLLVTIVVITYNSSEFVLETLNSIKNQTYSNIELIISDDCSIDQTLEICEQWGSNNFNRFQRVEIIQSAVNSGVSANINRALKISKGEWIKVIAGDDILLKNCIEINIDYAYTHNQSEIFFSKSLCFDSETGDIVCVRPTSNIKLENNSRKQFLRMLEKDFVNPVTVFYKRSLISSVGYINEKYPFMDDYPTWYKILKFGNIFHYIDVETVKYRISGKSLSTSSRRGKVNQLWLDSSTSFYKDILSKELLENKKYLCWLLRTCSYYFLNKSNVANLKIVFMGNRILYSIVNRIYLYLYK